MSKFQINVLLESPTKNIIVNVPSNLARNSCKFLVTSIIGKLTTGASPVFLHSSALQNSSIVYTEDFSNDVIATTVLTNVVTNSFTSSVNRNDIGFNFPSNLRANCNIDLTLKDHTGALLTDIDYAIVTIEVYIENEQYVSK